jgi:hypothetical protein
MTTAAGRQFSWFFAKRLQSFWHRVLRAYPIPGGFHLSFFIDKEGGSGNAPDFLPVHILFLPDAVRVGNFVVFVGKKGESKAVLFVKLFLRRRCIAADSQVSYV